MCMSCRTFFVWGSWAFGAGERKVLGFGIDTTDNDRRDRDLAGISHPERLRDSVSLPRRILPRTIACPPASGVLSQPRDAIDR